MSADNWQICPRCIDRQKQAKDAEVDAAAQAYGKVSVEEYEALRAKAVHVPSPLRETFREDYEFYGAHEGTVTASYSGHCTGCGLDVQFKHEVHFYTRETED